MQFDVWLIFATYFFRNLLAFVFEILDSKEMTLGTLMLTTRFVYMQVLLDKLFLSTSFLPVSRISQTCEQNFVFQTNSMCFRKKTSFVRRRYSDFVWLRHCLERNALNMYV